MNRYSTYDSLVDLAKIDEPIILNQENVRDALIKLSRENLSQKKFEPFKSHPIRMSDKTWEDFKDKKIKSGLSWNRFINLMLKKK